AFPPGRGLDLVERELGGGKSVSAGRGLLCAGRRTGERQPNGQRKQKLSHESCPHEAPPGGGLTRANGRVKEKGAERLGLPPTRQGWGRCCGAGRRSAGTHARTARHRPVPN